MLELLLEAAIEGLYNIESLVNALRDGYVERELFEIILHLLLTLLYLVFSLGGGAASIRFAIGDGSAILLS